MPRPRPRTSTGKSRPPRSGCRTLYTWLLALLATFLLGTVVVLSVVKSFFGIDWNDALDADEVNYYAGLPSLPYGSPTPDNGSVAIEKIPRIIHQTWKTTLLPSKWAKLTAQCKALHPDYEYMLWTDESSTDFIRQHYSWFLPTFMNYRLNIQRADVIRYFVLHKYGGVYMDLDIGCRRAMDPLLNYKTILPATKPVGISNDLIFAEPNSPFMDSVIHNLIAFDHYYLSDYPTVMFSTGPMFLSAVLSLWNSRSTYANVASALNLNGNDPLAGSPLVLGGDKQNNTESLTSSFSGSSKDMAGSFEMQDRLHTVRILPKELYGKNVEPDLVPDSFFYHYYGSSWHQNDSVIFTFLGDFGKTMMNVAFAIVIFGTAFAVVRRVRRRGKGIANNAVIGSRSGRSDGYDRLALDYDSDIEEGNGRCTPPLALPLSSTSTPVSRSSSSRRSRRRQYRRAVAAGARNWLFGGASNGLIGTLTSTESVGGRRRSASTGAISLPVHSSESGSEDTLFYTSSSEDGRETRRGSMFGGFTVPESVPSQQQNVRKASVWTEDGDRQHRRSALIGDQTAVAVSSITRMAPPLHRRASSQAGAASSNDSPSKTCQVSSQSPSAINGLRTPVPPSYLELPPPPPYRPPSPLGPTSPNAQGNNGNRAWYSSFFSITPSPTTPSVSPLTTAPTSTSVLPFSIQTSNNSTSNSNNNIPSSNAHIISRDDTLHVRPRDFSASASQGSQLQQDYISHTRQGSLADTENGEGDCDTFSLHSVKVRK